jgi:hypothetical protein
MKKRIWLRDGPRAAKAVWITETDQGLYVGPSVELKGVHFSYHQDGRRHLTNAAGDHFTHRSSNDRPLSAVVDHGNVGGFSVEPSKLQWVERASFRGDDLVIDYDAETRSDLPLVVSLHICESSNLAAFTDSIRSLGAGCKDICINFDLPLFPNLRGIVQIQYHTHVKNGPKPPEPMRVNGPHGSS